MARSSWCRSVRRVEPPPVAPATVARHRDPRKHDIEERISDYLNEHPLCTTGDLTCRGPQVGLHRAQPAHDGGALLVSATPVFLNRSGQSLQVGRGTTRQVARMLGASRAPRLALDGTAPDPQRSLIVDELDEARRHLATIDAEVAALERARDLLRWYERGRRGELLRRIDDRQNPLGHGQADVERLTIELASRSDPEQPRLSRAIDPLSRLEPRARDVSRDHGRGIER